MHQPICCTYSKLVIFHILFKPTAAFQRLFQEGCESLWCSPRVAARGVDALNLCWHRSNILASQQPLRGCYITSNQLGVYIYIWSHYVWTWQRATGRDSCSATQRVSLDVSQNDGRWWLIPTVPQCALVFWRLVKCDLMSAVAVRHSLVINKGVLPSVLIQTWMCKTYSKTLLYFWGGGVIFR